MAAKVIMVQGTMSNAGKSVLVAGLCRIFKQDGYRVAPFKSQNMALNSYITNEGLEMGRAQVMQAQAAGVEPTVHMNPILLKPTSEVGSQVIVQGEVVGNMRAGAYFQYKKQLIPTIMQSYEYLAQRNDVIVIEGAGSPAEINLKADDIVNMGMAKLVDAPVLLVGDIDRGGVFASLYGTVSLLEADERERIKGLIINKFRGDVEILRPGLTMLEELCHIPVVGVVPYLPLDLDDEDSLSERFTCAEKEAPLDVAVIRLPHLSNFTDFNPLERHPAISLRYVRKVNELRQPDLLVLPGTKNTMDDLKWLRESGLEAAILKLHGADTPVMGICGGYQMLGQSLKDPNGLEGGGALSGMGLLEHQTVFLPQKTRTQKQTKIPICEGLFASLSNCPVAGYEIHMGDSGEDALFSCTDDVFGTYLHGIFDSVEMQNRLVTLLLEKKGICWQEGQPVEDSDQYRERQYDTLAAKLRESLDIDGIYAMMDENKRGEQL